MERFQSWVALTALSLVIVGALFDELPEGGGGKARFALGTAFTSLILGAIFTAANLVDSLRNRLVGNAIENFVAILLMALWIIAIAFIQNPSNNIATAVENGMERIQYANLYFFSWLTFLSSVYTVGVTFRDNFQFGARFGQWMLLFTASIVLLATSVGAKDEICQYYAEKLQCERVKYATAVGAIGLVISALAVIMSVFDKMGHALEIGSTGLSFVLYIFGVFFLTSASGPAKVMGNMYFSLWGGCFISFALLIGVLFPNTAQDPTTQENHSGASPQEDHI